MAGGFMDPLGIPVRKSTRGTAELAKRGSSEGVGPWCMCRVIVRGGPQKGGLLRCAVRLAGICGRVIFTMRGQAILGLRAIRRGGIFGRFRGGGLRAIRLGGFGDVLPQISLSGRLPSKVAAHVGRIGK